MGITGKVVLITGAARGLGLEYARALHAAGAKIVAGDIADCAAARAAGDRVVAVRLNVTDMASCQAMTQAAVDAFGRIDALINNAALYGSLRGGRFNAIPEGDGTPQCR